MICKACGRSLNRLGCVGTAEEGHKGPFECDDEHPNNKLVDGLLNKATPKQTQTLRDQRRERIATVALQGFIASDYRRFDEAKDLARWAVDHADALIAELDRGSK